MKDSSSFFNLYSQGFIRVAACIPELKVSDPTFNAQKTLELAVRAHENRAVLAVFPELGISGYSNEDLFFQDALLGIVQDALAWLMNATKDMDMAVVVGAPLVVMNALYNCGVVLHKGKMAGIALKSYLPNYREFYEARQFRPAHEIPLSTLDILGCRDVPIGPDLIFDIPGIKDFRFFVEICEDLWSPIPPSSFASLAGATVVVNLSASNITVGKDEYRHDLASNQSARCLGAYIYTAAGFGESSTDLAWDGHAIMYENGTLVSESKRFSFDPQVIYADIDLDRLSQDRLRQTSFHSTRSLNKVNTPVFRRIDLDVKPPQGEIMLERQISRFPYVPAHAELRDKRCYEVYHIQVQGLAKRMKSTGMENLVIGVSGGLDSTHALIVCARAMDALGLPRTNIKAYTMPGFATSDMTYRHAVELMKALGTESGEIDIKPSCMQMMEDIDHPYAAGQDLYDVTFENVQAGQRTSILFRIANQRRAMVVGTGDLSELALGWCTYGVGDHMSHYNVNASVPKTLIQYIIRWVAEKELFGPDVSACLKGILATEISPELIPGTTGDKPAQSTQEVIGPYELQDFNTFYTTRYGYRPSKIAYLAWNAWHDRNKGVWPDVPEEVRFEYTIQEIRHWLEVFLHRFFGISQYKRSCIPNSPKVGSGGSLSPRGDYRAPSDSEEVPWIDDLKNVPETE